MACVIETTPRHRIRHNQGPLAGHVHVTVRPMGTLLSMVAHP